MKRLGILATTSTRPRPPKRGQKIHETDTGHWLRYDGRRWRRMRWLELWIAAGDLGTPTFRFGAIRQAAVMASLTCWTIALALLTVEAVS